MRKALLIFISLAVLSSCVTGQRYFVKIDSIKSLHHVGTVSYYLIPGLKDVDISDLRYQEFSTYIERALAKVGYLKANSLEEANVAIFLSYGIGDPQAHQYSRSIPIWGQTGVSASHTYGTFSSSGNIQTYGAYSTLNNTGTFSGTTAYTPTYGIVGTATKAGTYTTYLRHIILDAVDLNEYRRSKKKVDLWKTTITSTGSSNDFRMVFPFMVGAAYEYIGTNTGKQIEVLIYENDKRISEIKKVTVMPTKTNIPKMPEDKTLMAKKWAQKSYDSVLVKNWPGVITSSSVAISLDPSLIGPYINRAFAYCETGSPEKALKDCDKALQMQPNNAFAHNNKGYALELLNQIGGAALEYESSCDLGFAGACKNLQKLGK